MFSLEKVGWDSPIPVFMDEMILSHVWLREMGPSLSCAWFGDTKNWDHASDGGTDPLVPLSFFLLLSFFLQLLMPALHGSHGWWLHSVVVVARPARPQLCPCSQKPEPTFPPSSPSHWHLAPTRLPTHWLSMLA